MIPLIVGALFSLVSAAAEPPTAGASDDAYRALLELEPDARAAVVQRLVDEGHVPQPHTPVGAFAAERGMAASVEVRIERARDALRGGRPDRALPWLEPVQDDPRVATLYREAVDEHVYQQRERAGRWFRYAGRLRGEERRVALHRARDLLAEQASAHPDSIYADAVIRALSRVERTLDAEARRTASAAAGP